MFAANGATGGDTQRAQATDAAIFTIDNGLGVTKKASFVSMDADGFTLNFTTVSNTNAGQVLLARAARRQRQGGQLPQDHRRGAGQPVDHGHRLRAERRVLPQFPGRDAGAARSTNSRMSYGASDGVTEGSSAFTDSDLREPDQLPGDRQDRARRSSR